MHSIKVSVITSTMNRATYLRRVCESLQLQTIKDFEWIIGNDGSSDETLETVKELAMGSTFPITILSASQRIGKSKIDNHSINEARGEYIMLCDSDDWLESSAIEKMLNAVENDHHKKAQFLGAIGLSKDNLGGCVSKFPSGIKSSLPLNDLFYTHLFQEDCAILFKRNVLVNNPFPEVDFYTPEGCLWSKIGNMNVTLCHDIILNKEYNSKHAISYTHKFVYSKGKAVSIAQIYNNLAKKHKKEFNLFLDIFTYLRFSIHGDISLKKMFQFFPDKYWLLISVVLPIAFIFSIRDRFRKIVDKTHIKFEAASLKYKLDVHKYEKVK